MHNAPMRNEKVPDALPQIPLTDVPEKTKDFLIAHSISGQSVAEVIRDILNLAAKEVEK